MPTSLVPLLTNHLIGAFGWRGAYIGFGGLFALVIFPILLFFFYDARDRDSSRSRAEQSKDLPGRTVRKGFHARQFYQIGVAGFLITGVL